MIASCHQCPRRQHLPHLHTMVCGEDGRTFHEHEVANVCPLGTFGVKGRLAKALDIPPPPILAGDIVAGLAKKVGADRAAKFVARLAGKKDCGCAKRQHWLNRLHLRIARLFSPHQDAAVAVDEDGGGVQV